MDSVRIVVPVAVLPLLAGAVTLVTGVAPLPVVVVEPEELVLLAVAEVEAVVALEPALVLLLTGVVTLLPETEPLLTLLLLLLPLLVEEEELPVGGTTALMVVTTPFCVPRLEPKPVACGPKLKTPLVRLLMPECELNPATISMLPVSLRMVQLEFKAILPPT